MNIYVPWLSVNVNWFGIMNGESITFLYDKETIQSTIYWYLESTVCLLLVALFSASCIEDDDFIESEIHGFILDNDLIFVFHWVLSYVAYKITKSKNTCELIKKHKELFLEALKHT